MSKKITYCYIQSLWNFTIFLILFEKNKFESDRKYVIISERDVIPLYLKKEFKGVLDFKVLNSTFKKIKFLYYLKRNNKEIYSIIKFLNYSYLSQLISGLISYESITYIDDGTTFINYNSPSIKYAGYFKNKLKRILSFKDFQPDFMNFHGVNKAFIFNTDLLNIETENNSVELIELSKIIALDDFNNISDKIIPNIDQIKGLTCETLILGSALVEHGFLNSSIYLKIIYDIYKNNKDVLFKPHPSESNLDLKDINIVPEKYNKYPIELLISIIKPKKVISFGSTTSFLLMNMKLHIELDIYFPNKFMSKKLELTFNKLKDRINITYI